MMIRIRHGWRTGSAGVLLCSLLLFFFSQCKNSTDPHKKTGTFYLYNLGVTVAPYNTRTGRAGDFHFLLYQGALFLEFGAMVSSAPDAKPLPTFEYRLWKNASVFAAAPGKVSRFVYQSETNDYEIQARSTVDEDWVISYDHVINPRVQMNSTIDVGDTLGQAGTWNNNWSRTEIMVQNYATGLSYCPFARFYPDSLAVYQAKVARLMAEWETFIKTGTVWNEQAMVYAGCTVETIKSK